MKKLMMIILTICSVGICMVADGPQNNPGSPINVYGNACVEGPKYSPDNKYVVWVYCYDAAGTYIVVVDNLPGADPAKPRSEQARYDKLRRENPPWTWDVVSFTWLPNSLKIETSYIYGTSKIYIIDLNNKSVLEESNSPNTPIGWSY